MWRKSCALFPPGTYACLTYPQEVNLQKNMYFFSLFQEYMFLNFLWLLIHCCSQEVLLKLELKVHKTLVSNICICL